MMTFLNKRLALTTSKVVEYFSINEKVRSAFDMKVILFYFDFD